MKITSDELRQAKEDFLTRHRPEREQEGDITAKMAAIAWDVSESLSVDILNAASEGDAPELLRIPDVILANGKRGTVWRIIKQ